MSLNTFFTLFLDVCCSPFFPFSLFTNKLLIKIAKEQRNVFIAASFWLMSEWVRERMRTIVHTNAGICVVTHAHTVQSVFMTQSGREWENGERLPRICWCVCAQPVSLIGQMSCVHYKRGTLVRWEAVSPGIRSVGQQSTRPQGGLSGWFTGGMEPMCHADHVWETEGLVFVCYSHVCLVSLHSADSHLQFTGNRKLQQDAGG